MNIRKNKGITLIALVITIVILLIIASISITSGITEKKEIEEKEKIVELNMIQHALLERYTKSQLTKEKLPGKDVTLSEVQNIINDINNKSNENISLKSNGEYKKLDNKEMKELGFTKYKDTYIVNYKTGEVINVTIKVTNSGKALYVYSTEN